MMVIGGGKMPFVIIFIFLVVGCTAYIYFNKNQDRYTRKKPEENDPFSVSYLSDIVDVEEDSEKDAE